MASGNANGSGSAAVIADTDFKRFCDDIFASLYRVDQRHAGETYLRGLLNCPGRKSIRRLVATAPGRSEQSLQQFLNQSPWDPQPIRRRVLMRLVERVLPAAWVIEEMAFPKNGRYSAAVERQYVRSMGKVSNCQLAITVTLTDERYSIPVNWKLTVPESWGRDEERRLRSRMPDGELPRPYWQYQIEVVDEMTLDWGIPSAPLLVDTRHRSGADAMLAALDIRGLQYLAQVGPMQTVRFEGQRPRGPHGPVPVPGAPASWRGGVNDLVHRLRPGRETVVWRSIADGSFHRSQFAMVPVLPVGADGGAGVARGPRTERVLVVEWPLSKAQPQGFWLSNIIDRPLADLVALAKLRHRVAPRLEQFAKEFGLRDYEGRTFAGWHHHVTLTTAAYAYRVLRELGDTELGRTG